MVYRAIDPHSEEARTNLKIKEVCNAQFQGLLNKMFFLHGIREKNDVMAGDPQARFVGANLLIGEKGVDLQDPEKWRFKARLVIGGYNTKNSQGERVRDALNHVVPVTLELIRISFFHSSCFPDGISLIGDAEQGYTKAIAQGDTLWVSLPKSLVPSSWSSALCFANAYNTLRRSAGWIRLGHGRGGRNAIHAIHFSMR